MRTGAIFARGSCRVLKWVALAGMVFALGAGQATAQITIVPANDGKVTEGGMLNLKVTAKIYRAATDTTSIAAQTIIVTAVPATESTTPAAVDSTYELADISFNPATVSLTFPVRPSGTPGGHVSIDGNVVLQVSHDPDAEDELFEAAFMLDGADGLFTDVDGSVSLGAPGSLTKVTIEDDETQNYVLTLNDGETPKEGEDFELTLKADPAHVDDSVALRLHLSDSMYKLDGTSAAGITLGNLDTPDTDATPDENMTEITVTAPDNDKNRSDDPLTIRVLATATSKELGTEDFEVADKNPLPEVKVMVVDDDGDALDPQPESLMEGETVKIMVTAIDDKGKDKKAAEKLTVSLMPTGTAGMRDYNLSMHPITIDNGKASSAAVELTAREDEDVDMETLMFDASVAGDKDIGAGTRDIMGVLSLMIEDRTQKLVWTKTQDEVEAAIYRAKEAGMGADEMFNPGEMIEVMGSTLFNAAEGVMLSYTAMSDNGDVASTSVGGGTVTVMAGDMEGMAHITIKAHASMPSGVKIVDQTDPAEASVMFPVDVMLEALTLTLMGPEDMNVAEGMSAEVTVMANRAVTEDMEVMLMRDRAMSSASDDDFTADSIMLMAGDEMATGMVMAVEDEMAEDMEELVLYAMAGDMEVSGTAKLYIWDAAVPALPIIAQLLLGGLLAVGGFRRYRRRS